MANSKVNPGAQEVVADRVRLFQGQIVQLQALLAELELEPTWPVAGSLGHVTETLENLLAGFGFDGRKGGR
jgi:hypothetical protein